MCSMKKGLLTEAFLADEKSPQSLPVWFPVHFCFLYKVPHNELKCGKKCFFSEKNPGYFFRSKITFLIVLNFFSDKKKLIFFFFSISFLSKKIRKWPGGSSIITSSTRNFLKNITFRLWGIFPANYNFLHILGQCVKALALHWRVLINNHLWRAAFLQVFQGHLRDVKLDFPKM